MFAVEPFRPIYFASVLTLVALTLFLLHIAPAEPSLGYFLVTLPIVGAVLNTAVVCAGGFATREVIRRTYPKVFDSGFLLGVVVATGLLILVNTGAFALMRHFGVQLVR